MPDFITTTANYLIHRFTCVPCEVTMSANGNKSIGAILRGDTGYTFFILLKNGNFLILLPGGNKLQESFFPLEEQQLLFDYFSKLPVSQP